MALQQLVEYSYTGEILITEDNVQVWKWYNLTPYAKTFV
jgi:hypothetical protein